MSLSDHTARMRAGDLVGRETRVTSSAFRIRRLGEILVIETLNPKLENWRALQEVFEQALQKTSQGIVLHFPNPQWVNSLVLDTIRQCHEHADEHAIPLLSVLHPKIRLVLDMFELRKSIRTSDRLDRALVLMRMEAEERERKAASNGSAEEE